MSLSALKSTDNREASIALIRDDVTKISLNVEPRLGGDHFAWFVDV